MLSKKQLELNKQIRYAIGECNILGSCNSPFITKLWHAFQTERNLYLILD